MTLALDTALGDMRSAEATNSEIELYPGMSACVAINHWLERVGRRVLGDARTPGPEAG